jgi:hypothetical protein
MKKPGEKAMTPLKRSPLSNASEIAYKAPSENPPMTNRVALIALQHYGSNLNRVPTALEQLGVPGIPSTL